MSAKDKVDMEAVFSKLNKDIAWLKEKTIFLTVHGSHAYALNTETSDIDLRGIAIAPAHYYHGFNQTFETWMASDPHDMQIFDLIKFFNLTKDGNPNTLELLFTEPEDHLFVSELGKTLIDNRDKFLSRNLKARYLGYAKSQMHRLKNHKRWLDVLTRDKEIKPPMSREEFGLSKQLTIPRDQLLTVQAVIEKKLEEWNPDFEPFSDPQKIWLQGRVSKILAEMDILNDNKWMLAARSLGFGENFILLLQKEKAYANLHSDYENYLSWKRNRNPKRAELEAKIGYDAKHMTQLIRLCLLGKEVLLTGKLRVKRVEDREMLLEIKNCLWPYEKAIELAERLEREVEEAYFKSPLPLQPDIKKLDELCVSLIERSLEGER